MPQAADLILANGASTPVSKTFTLLSPAGGFNASAAQWALKEGTVSGVFPILMASAQSNSASKKAHWTVRVPSSYTDSVTGLTKVGSAFNAEIIVTVPNDFPEALKADAVAFVRNLLALSPVQASIRDGLPMI